MRPSSSYSALISGRNLAWKDVTRSKRSSRGKDRPDLPVCPVAAAAARTRAATMAAAAATAASDAADWETHPERAPLTLASARLFYASVRTLRAKLRSLEVFYAWPRERCCRVLCTSDRRGLTKAMTWCTELLSTQQSRPADYDDTVRQLLSQLKQVREYLYHADLTRLVIDRAALPKLPLAERRSMLKVKIKTDNAAFADGNRATEVARIHQEIAKKIQGGQTEGICLDINGNRVGTWKLT